MITSAQMRAARAMLGLDQRGLAEMAGLSLPTIQRMEASGGQVRGIIDTLMKVVEALESAGVELIAENSPSTGSGRGVRLRESAARADRAGGAERAAGVTRVGGRLNARPAPGGVDLESAERAG